MGSVMGRAVTDGGPRSSVSMWLLLFPHDTRNITRSVRAHGLASLAIISIQG